MRIADIGAEGLLYFALNRLIQAAAGRPVGIQQRLTSVGGGDQMAAADSVLTECREMLLQ